MIHYGSLLYTSSTMSTYGSNSGIEASFQWGGETSFGIGGFCPVGGECCKFSDEAIKRDTSKPVAGSHIRNGAIWSATSPKDNHSLSGSAIWAVSESWQSIKQMLKWGDHRFTCYKEIGAGWPQNWNLRFRKYANGNQFLQLQPKQQQLTNSLLLHDIGW